MVPITMPAIAPPDMQLHCEVARVRRWRGCAKTFVSACLEDWEEEKREVTYSHFEDLAANSQSLTVNSTAIEWQCILQ